jgi:hypothetical protein
LGVAFAGINNNSVRNKESVKPAATLIRYNFRDVIISPGFLPVLTIKLYEQ